MEAPIQPIEKADLGSLLKDAAHYSHVDPAYAEQVHRILTDPMPLRRSLPVIVLWPAFGWLCRRRRVSYGREALLVELAERVERRRRERAAAAG